MYDELIKSLRFCAMTDLSEEEYPCDPCEYKAPGKYHIKNKVCYLGCSQQMMLHAADAIEELSAAEKKYLANINALETENQHLKRERYWIPVTERLPEFEGAVLCMRKSNVYGVRPYQEILYVDEYGFKNYDDIYLADGVVTHWMPLPQPPEEE